jgi:hypothetical protein
MKSYSADTPGNKVSLLLLLPLLVAVGCHKDDVQVYNTSNDQGQPPATSSATTNSSDMALPPGHPNVSSMQQMPALAADQSAQPSLTWTTPSGWTQVPPSEMRVASFKVGSSEGKQADVSIVPLTGSGGGDPANVNRWRGQVGLPDASDDAILNSAENIEAAGQPAQLYDIAGQTPDTGVATRILAAIQHRDGTAWFFKMTGDADWVEQQKATFIQFVKSVSFAQAQAQLPPGHPAIGDLSEQPPATAPASQNGQPTWQVPADWKEVPDGPFLVAKFTISGDGGEAAVNVSAAEGDGGGLPANVNRWRGQLGLPPISEILTTTFSVPNGQAQLVDMSGTNAENNQPAETIGIIVTQPNGTWFYKLMGDPKVVAGQRDIFTQFVKGVKY